MFDDGYDDINDYTEHDNPLDPFWDANDNGVYDPMDQWQRENYFGRDDDERDGERSYDDEDEEEDHEDYSFLVGGAVGLAAAVAASRKPAPARYQRELFCNVCGDDNYWLTPDKSFYMILRHFKLDMEKRVCELFFTLYTMQPDYTFSYRKSGLTAFSGDSFACLTAQDPCAPDIWRGGEDSEGTEDVHTYFEIPENFDAEQERWLIYTIAIRDVVTKTEYDIRSRIDIHNPVFYMENVSCSQLDYSNDFAERFADSLQADAYELPPEAASFHHVKGIRVFPGATEREEQSAAGSTDSFYVGFKDLVTDKAALCKPVIFCYDDTGTLISKYAGDLKTHPEGCEAFDCEFQTGGNWQGNLHLKAFMVKDDEEEALIEEQLLSAMKAKWPAKQAEKLRLEKEKKQLDQEISKGDGGCLLMLFFVAIIFCVGLLITGTGPID